jgi:hypothetical protein
MWVAASQFFIFVSEGTKTSVEHHFTVRHLTESLFDQNKLGQKNLMLVHPIPGPFSNTGISVLKIFNTGSTGIYRY